MPLTYSQYYDRIYKTKQRPVIDWGRLAPVDIIDIVLDDRANKKELVALAELAIRDKRGGAFDWVWNTEEVALKIVMGVEGLRLEDIY